MAGKMIFSPPAANVTSISDPVYAFQSDNGEFTASFATAIGTDDAVKFTSRGYSFGWRPENVIYVDDQGNMDVIFGANANASAQVYKNRVSYVGTSQLTTDIFDCQGGGLKHTVQMVAPPRVPASFVGTPVQMASGGVITYDSTLEVWAAGEKQTGDFEVTGDVAFKDAQGDLIYKLPMIEAVDADGNKVDGTYKITFNADGTISFYGMVPWDWLQSVAYPVEIDPTILSGNNPLIANTTGVKKYLDTTSDGTLWFMNTDGSVAALYYSTDDGNTWTKSSTSLTSVWLYNSSYTSFGSLWIDSSDNLHLVWNDASYNLYYAGFTYTSSSKSWNVANTTHDEILTSSYNGSQSDVIAFTAADNKIHCLISTIDSASGSSPYIAKFIELVLNADLSVASATNAGQNTDAYTNGDTPIIDFQRKRGTKTPSTSQPLVFLAVPNSNNQVQFLQWAWNATNNNYASGTCKYAIDAIATSNGLAIACDDSYAYVGCAPGSQGTAPPLYVLKYDPVANTLTNLNLPSLSGETAGNAYQVIPVLGQNSDVYAFLNDGGKTIYQNLYSGSSSTWGAWTSVESGLTGSWVSSSRMEVVGKSYIAIVYGNNPSGGTVSANILTITLNSPPNAPTLNPVSNFNATTAETFTWTFSDPNAGDTQSAYQLQIVDVASGSTVVDTGKAASTSSTYTLAANTLTNGKQYQWRVTTWDSSGAQGPWSSYSTFNTAAAPTVTLTNPAASSSQNGSTLTAQWSYSDPASNAESSYQVQLLNSTDATVLWDSGTVNGSGTSQTINYALANSTTYHARVRATNSQGITSAWSDNSFTVSYTAPATPTLSLTAQASSGSILLTIANPAPSSGQPSVSYNEIYRRETGTTMWTRIQTNFPTSQNYTDYNLASGQSYDYYVNAIASNGTNTVSATASNSVTLTGLWIHDVNNPSTTILNLLYQQKPKSSEWKPEATMMKFAGRTRPVVEFGEQEDYTLNATVTMTTAGGDWATLRNLIRTKDTVCVRDGRGRKVFGVILDLKENDEVYGETADLTVTEIDYTEAV